MKPEVWIKFWIHLMLPLMSSGVTLRKIDLPVTQRSDFQVKSKIKPSEINLRAIARPRTSPLNSTHAELSRTKRELVTASIIAIGSATILGISSCVTAYILRKEEKKSGCYWEPDMCPAEKKTQELKQKMNNLWNKIVALDKKFTKMHLDYRVMKELYHTWIDSLSYIESVKKDIEEIGRPPINQREIERRLQTNNGTCWSDYENGIKELVHGSWGEAIGAYATRAIAFNSIAVVAQGTWLVLYSQNHWLLTYTVGVPTVSAIGITVGAGVTGGLCLHDILVTQQESAAARLEEQNKLNKELEKIVKGLEADEKLYNDQISILDRGFHNVSLIINDLLQQWSEYCPKYNEETEREDKLEANRICEKFRSRKRTCVTCKTTLLEDLRLLNKHWKYMERIHDNLLSELKRREADKGRIMRNINRDRKTTKTAAEVYEHEVENWPEFETFIEQYMATVENWTESFDWTEWVNHGPCSADCENQAQTRICQGKSCLGPENRRMKCIAEDREKCIKVNKVCPSGWKKEHEICYKSVPMTTKERELLAFNNKKPRSTLYVQALNQICCDFAYKNDLVTHQKCSHRLEDEPKMARTIQPITDIYTRPQGEENFQRVYLDLTSGYDIDDRKIKCESKNETSGECRPDIESRLICQIDNEENLFYKMMPRRCISRQESTDGDTSSTQQSLQTSKQTESVCLREERLAKLQLSYQPEVPNCLQEKWKLEDTAQLFHKSGKWAITTDRRVGVLSKNLGFMNLAGPRVHVNVGSHPMAVLEGLKPGILYEQTSGKWQELLNSPREFLDISVGNDDQFWAIDNANNLWRGSLDGSSEKITSTLGSPQMNFISVAADKIWGATSDGHVYSCPLDNTSGTTVDWSALPNYEFEHEITSLSNGDGFVFITTAGGHLFYHTDNGDDSRVTPATPDGPVWVMANPKSDEAGTIQIKMVYSDQNDIFAVDSNGHLFTMKNSCAAR